VQVDLGVLLFGFLAAEGFRATPKDWMKSATQCFLAFGPIAAAETSHPVWAAKHGACRLDLENWRRCPRELSRCT
jgi:hypothetical protein